MRMVNGEFKKEERLVIKNTQNTSSENKKDFNIKNLKFSKVIIFLNIIILVAIAYFLVEQYYFKLSIENNIYEIKMKVENLEGLNNNLEKLNNNFQVLDIINSNTRKIPDILLSLEENKKIIDKLEFSQESSILDEIKNIKINVDFTDQFSMLSKSLLEDINNILDEKISNNNVFQNKLDVIDNKLNDIDSIKDIIDKLYESSNKIYKNIESITNSQEKDKNSKLEDKMDSVVMRINKLNDDMNNYFNRLEEMGNKFYNDLNEKIDYIKQKDYSSELKIIEDRINSIDHVISNLNNTIEDSQNKYYKKIEYILNKKDIVSLIKELNEYISSDNIKLIEMVLMYNNIAEKYSDYNNDKDIIISFENITKEVYSKFEDIVNKEIDYLTKKSYNENIKKDINYLVYVFNKIDKIKGFEKYYENLKVSMEKLENLEKEKIDEYNKVSSYKLKKYIELFSKKKLLQEEIIEGYKKYVLTIDPDLLNDNIKSEYYNIVDKTKKILKDKYIW
jgi:chaperonin cofactor prefoldin